MRHAIDLALASLSAALVLSGPPAVSAAELAFEGAPRHPTVFVAPEDVERARWRIEIDPDAKEWFASIKQDAAAWADKSPA